METPEGVGGFLLFVFYTKNYKTIVPGRRAGPPSGETGIVMKKW